VVNTASGLHPEPIAHADLVEKALAGGQIDPKRSLDEERLAPAGLAQGHG